MLNSAFIDQFDQSPRRKGKSQPAKSNSPKPQPRASSSGSVSSLLTSTWSGTEAHSRAFRRTFNPVEVNTGPDTFNPNPTSLTSTTHSSGQKRPRRRRPPPHLAWHAQPTSLVSKSISAPHRSSYSATLLMEHFGHTHIDVRAPTEWSITSLDVTIPVAREEDTSPTNESSNGNRRSGSLSRRGSSGQSSDTPQQHHHQLDTRGRQRNTASSSSSSSSSRRDLSFSSTTALALASSASSSAAPSSTTSLLRSASGRYTSYIICVVAGHKTWHIGHRYSDFEQLHMSLRNHLGRAILPPFPPKYRLHFNNLDPSFVEKRKSQLEVYLGSLVRITQVWSCQRLMVDFLDNQIETLGMQTKYERMMRVQVKIIAVVDLVLIFVFVP